jgi:hypothetical protein
MLQCFGAGLSTLAFPRTKKGSRDGLRYRTSCSFANGFNDIRAQLALTGVYTSLRFSFAFFGVNECNGFNTN